MRCLKSVTWILAAGLMLAGASGARADSALAELLPQLKSMEPPSWLKTGARLSFYGASAKVRMKYTHFVPDEHGDWYDPTTGQHYREEDTLSGAGEGVTQLDAAVVGSQRAMFSLRMFLLAQQDRGGKQFLPRDSGVVVGPVACCGDFYVNPKVLAGLKAVKRDSLTILPMPYSNGHQTYDAVAFKYETEHAMFCSIYDKATGIQVASSSAVDNGDNTTTLAMSRFLGLRQRDLGWAGGAAPDWLRSVQRWGGQGNYTMTMANTPVFPIPVTVSAAVDERGADWLRYHLYTETGGAAAGVPATSTVNLISGPGQIGGVWLPPTALARLSAGQVLDSDPVIGMTTTVVGSQGNLVQIREAGRSHQIDYVYDTTSGMVRRMRQSETTMNMAGPVTTGVDVQFSAAQ